MRTAIALGTAAIALACATGPTSFDPLELVDLANAALSEGREREARELAERAARSGNAEALNLLAMMLDTGIGGERDERGARALFERAAAGGSAVAKVNLGNRLLEGSEGEQRRAVQLLSEAHASEGLGAGAVKIVAAEGLARAYLIGMGVEEDVRRGVDFLEEADSGGQASAGVLYLLGRSFDVGWGGRERDAARSFGYFKRSAEAGVSISAWYVGMALIHGDGVERDEHEAYRWIRKAAEAGEVRGEISTAVMLATGQGVEENDEEARHWYERAAASNSAHALRGLGLMLFTGEGGPADIPRGLAYVRLAARGENDPARRLQLEIEGGVSEEDRSAALGIEEAWIREHGGLPSDDY